MRWRATIRREPLLAAARDDAQLVCPWSRAVVYPHTLCRFRGSMPLTRAIKQFTRFFRLCPVTGLPLLRAEVRNLTRDHSMRPQHRSEARSGTITLSLLCFVQP